MILPHPFKKHLLLSALLILTFLSFSCSKERVFEDNDFNSHPAPISSPTPLPENNRPEQIRVEVFKDRMWKEMSPITSRMKLNPPVFHSIAIHHTAMKTPINSDMLRILRSIQRYHIKSKGWGDIAYHYLIDPHGKIYQGRELKYVADTSTDFDPTGYINICLMGNFENVEAEQKAKTSLVSFLSALLIKHNLTAKNVVSHKTIASTLCPGKYLHKWLVDEGFDSIEKERKMLLQRDVFFEIVHIEKTNSESKSP